MGPARKPWDGDVQTCCGSRGIHSPLGEAFAKCGLCKQGLAPSISQTHLLFHFAPNFASAQKWDRPGRHDVLWAGVSCLARILAHVSCRAFGGRGAKQGLG